MQSPRVSAMSESCGSPGRSGWPGGLEAHRQRRPLALHGRAAEVAGFRARREPFEMRPDVFYLVYRLLYAGGVEEARP